MYVCVLNLVNMFMFVFLLVLGYNFVIIIFVGVINVNVIEICRSKNYLGECFGCWVVVELMLVFNF